MDTVSDVYITNYIPTIYTTPCIMHYQQNGKQHEFEIFAERNGVVIIVYNSTRNVLTLVKQFRASVYFNSLPEEERLKEMIDVKKYPPANAVTLEFCAGLEDKNIPTEQVAREEILEECGYDVTIDKLERIGTIKNLTDTTGARSTFYYCEVTDDMRVSQGGGVADEGENIEVIEMKVEDIMKYITQNYVPSPANFLYGFYWFLYNKYDKRS